MARKKGGKNKALNGIARESSRREHLNNGKEKKRDAVEDEVSSDGEVQVYAGNRATDASLLDDVRKFAAELGFSSGEGVHTFDEFDPVKAKKKANNGRERKEPKRDREGETGER